MPPPYSSILTEYLGEGIAASRPGTLDISPTALGLYYATDTKVLSLWDGSAWQTSATAGSEPVNIQTGTTYAVVNADQGMLIIASNTAAVGWDLPEAGGGGEFLDGWFADVRVSNTGTLTITPVTSTMDGAATLVMTQNQGVRIVSDGTNYHTVRGMASGGGGGGTVTQVDTGTGLTGGPITNTGTISLANINTGEVLANLGTAAAAPSGELLTTVIDTLGTTEGAIITRGTSVWAELAPGTAGQVLSSNGTAAAIGWENQAYIVAGFSGEGTIVANQVLLAHRMAAPVTFPANFGAVGNGTESSGGSLINATGATTISVDVCPTASDPTNNANWSAIGSVVIGAGGHTATFTTAGGTAQAVVYGDYLRLKAPNPADATLTAFFASLAGAR